MLKSLKVEPPRIKKVLQPDYNLTSFQMLSGARDLRGLGFH